MVVKVCQGLKMVLSLCWKLRSLRVLAKRVSLALYEMDNGRSQKLKLLQFRWVLLHLSCVHSKPYQVLPFVNGYIARARFRSF